MIQKRAKREISRNRQIEEIGDLWKSPVAALLYPEDQKTPREASIRESCDLPLLPVHFSAAERFLDALESSRKVISEVELLSMIIRCRLRSETTDRCANRPEEADGERFHEFPSKRTSWAAFALEIEGDPEFLAAIQMAGTKDLRVREWLLDRGVPLTTVKSNE
jgi:hypothetical protein